MQGHGVCVFGACACGDGGTVSVYYFPTEEDDEGPTMKEKITAVCMEGIEIFCVWDCCGPWLKIQEFIAFIVFDPFVELFITLCIVVNTVFMAMDHHDMNESLEIFLKNGNYVACVILQKDLKCWFAELTVDLERVQEIVRYLFQLFEMWKTYDEKKEIQGILGKMPKPKPQPTR